MAMIICPSCGGEFDELEAKCPYCDSMNPKGAEAKFMDDLDDKIEDLEELVDSPDAGGSYVNEIKESSASAISRGTKIAIAILAVVGIVALIGFVLSERDNSKANYADELVWQNETFAELDALYEEEKYDEIIKRIDKYEDQEHEVWSWQHYNYIQTLARYYDLKEELKYLDEEDDDSERKDISQLLVYDTFYLVFREYEKEVTDEAELVKLEPIYEDARTIAHERLGFDDAKLKKLQAEVTKDDYLEWKACEKVANKYYKKFK